MQRLDKLEYEMMSDDEVFTKYHTIAKDKIVIINQPCFIYNSDEKKILYGVKDRFEITNRTLQYKKGNKFTVVDTFTKCPKSIKEGYKIVVYRHKTKYFRFKILQLVQS